MALMNMEGEGIQDIRDYFRKQLLRLGVVKPTADEQAQLQQEAQNQQPDPQATYLKAAANQADADALQAQAQTVLIAANAEKAKAQTMQILADIKSGKLEDAFKSIESLSNMALQNAGGNTTPNLMQNPTAPPALAPASSPQTAQ